MNKKIPWAFNIFVAYKLLMIFTFFWLIYVVLDYSILIQRPASLYRPVWWIQSILLPKLMPIQYFTLSIMLSCIMTFICLRKKRLIPSILLALLVLLLNSVRWNYGGSSHVGHTFVLTHLFFCLLPIKQKIHSNEFDLYAKIIKLPLIGVLITYSMAGIWKFLSITKTIYANNVHNVSWLHSDAVELNAIASKRSLDNTILDFMFELYQIPYIWEIITIFTFVIQLTAVFAVINRTFANIIMTVLVSFHLFNTFFNDIAFNTAPIILIIILFPYHIFLNNKYENFKKEFIAS